MALLPEQLTQEHIYNQPPSPPAQTPVTHAVQGQHSLLNTACTTNYSLFSLPHVCLQQVHTVTYPQQILVFKYIQSMLGYEKQGVVGGGNISQDYPEAKQFSNLFMMHFFLYLFSWVEKKPHFWVLFLRLNWRGEGKQEGSASAATRCRHLLSPSVCPLFRGLIILIPGIQDAGWWHASPIPGH